MKFPDPPTCFLFDNGSLRAASTLNLRAVAKTLEAVIGVPVKAVSLLHSSGVDAGDLDGERAQLLEPSLQDWLLGEAKGAAVALPFFFGPSAALTEYVPERLDSLRRKFPEARLGQAECLVDVTASADERVAEALAEAVRRVASAEKLSKPNVVLVDHGSPQRAVAEVRNFLGEQVSRLLSHDVEMVGVASMERRPSAEYAFNDPLLAARLRTAPFDAGDVVLALQFLSPGRHAGAGGDIAEICTAAKKDRPGLRTWMTETIGADARVISVLAERYRAAVERMER